MGAVTYRIGAREEAHDQVQSHHGRHDREFVERCGSSAALRPTHAGLRGGGALRDRLLAQAGSAASVPKSVTQLQANPCGAPPTTLTCILARCHRRRMPAGR